MSPQSTFDVLKYFIETNSTFQSALLVLTPGTEIELIVGDHLKLALVREAEHICILDRAAQNAGLVVHLAPLTVERLVSTPVNSLTELGERVLKEVLLGALTIKRKASWWSLLTRGYLRLLQFGGQKALDLARQLKA